MSTPPPGPGVAPVWELQCSPGSSDGNRIPRETRLRRRALRGFRVGIRSSCVGAVWVVPRCQTHVSETCSAGVAVRLGCCGREAWTGQLTYTRGVFLIV